jgi:hypothetical protein
LENAWSVAGFFSGSVDIWQIVGHDFSLLGLELLSWSLEIALVDTLTLSSSGHGKVDCIESFDVRLEWVFGWEAFNQVFTLGEASLARGIVYYFTFWYVFRVWSSQKELLVNRPRESSVCSIIKAFLWNLFRVTELEFDLLVMLVSHIDKLSYLFRAGELNLSLITWHLRFWYVI